jgi:hypothetical protein
MYNFGAGGRNWLKPAISYDWSMVAFLHTEPRSCGVPVVIFFAFSSPPMVPSLECIHKIHSFVKEVSPFPDLIASVNEFPSIRLLAMERYREEVLTSPP